MENNVKKYMRLLEDLKNKREDESNILDKMGLLWQAMSLEERALIRVEDPTWPPPPNLPGQKSNK